MAVLVKGMEMPEHCGYCRFRYDGICHALQKTQYSQEECPLVTVPPHGRLIDADALVRELNSIRASFGSANGLVEGGLNIAVSTVNGMPTIIPAGEGEK